MSKETVIPQAHSYTFFEKVMLAAKDKGLDQNVLAKKFDVQRRTISYYVQLARWINFVTEDELSDLGKSFIDADKKNRIALFKEAILAFSWVKKAADNDGTTAAFDIEIAKVSDLAESTRKRRARAMSKLWISVLEADGTKKGKKKKKIIKKKKVKSTTKKAVPKKGAKKPVAKKAAPKKAKTKSAPQKSAPKKSAPKKGTKKAAKTTGKAKALPKKKTENKEYSYQAPKPNTPPSHPLVWVGKKVVKGAFKVAGKLLRFL